MRNVLKNHSEVAEYWAKDKQNLGKASRMFFENKTIYSYGYHFPIAKKLEDGTILFTLACYSSSTSNHINHVRSAIGWSNDNILYAYDLTSTDNSLKYWYGNIDSMIEQIKKPANRKFEYRVQNLNRNAKQLQAYIAYFKIELPFERQVQLSFIQAGNVVEKLRQK